MGKAGKYQRRLLWKQRAIQRGPNFGRERDQFTDNGYLWGAVEDLAGGERQSLGADQPNPTATVRLRNYPAVKPKDRLYDAGYAELWEVISVSRGDNEVICDVGPARES